MQKKKDSMQNRNKHKERSKGHYEESTKIYLDGNRKEEAKGGKERKEEKRREDVK